MLNVMPDRAYEPLSGLLQSLHLPLLGPRWEPHSAVLLQPIGEAHGPMGRSYAVLQMVVPQ